jgi:hypothetical protein
MISGQSSWARDECRVKMFETLGGLASRAVNGAPRLNRSRIVASKEVARYSSVMTVRSGIQAEIASVGIRIPERLNANPIWPGRPCRRAGRLLAAVRGRRCRRVRRT